MNCTKPCTSRTVEIYKNIVVLKNQIGYRQYITVAQWIHIRSVTAVIDVEVNRRLNCAVADVDPFAGAVPGSR